MPYMSLARMEAVDLSSVLVKVTYCRDETPLPKVTWRGKSLFGLHMPSHSLLREDKARKTGQEPRNRS